MALVSPTEASRLVGRHTAILYRAMRDGVLSYTVAPTGNRLIDVSELERVYGSLTVPPVRRRPGRPRLQPVAERIAPSDAPAAADVSQIVSEDVAISIASEKPEKQGVGESEGVSVERRAESHVVSDPARAESHVDLTVQTGNDLLIAALRCQIVDLQKRLDRADERFHDVNNRMMALLEDRRKETAAPPDVIQGQPPPPPSERRRWWPWR